MLNPDERELVQQVEDVEPDFYAPLLALALYRYDKDSTPFGMPTERIVKIVTSCYEDLNDKGNVDES